MNEMTYNLDFSSLYNLLDQNNVDEFLCTLDEIADDPQSINVLLAGQNWPGLLTPMKKILDLFFVSSKDVVAFVQYSCCNGNWKSLEILLEKFKLDINSLSLLPIVVKNIDQRPSEEVNFEKCFDILMNMQDIDINQLDASNKSALNYAIKSNNSDVIVKLLKNGAYIGVKSELNRFSISQMDPNILEKHFDSCITSNGLSVNDDNFEIYFDFKNLIRVRSAKNRNLANELAVIEYISKSKHLRQLMLHPLVLGFLSLKWNHLAPYFYVNFLFCSLFAIVTITYILSFNSYDTSQYTMASSRCGVNQTRNDQIEDDFEFGPARDLMRISIFILTIYIIAREIYQFILSPLRYLKSYESYLDCTVIVFLMLILFDVQLKSWRPTVAATTILLISVEVFLLAGSLPFWSYSTYYISLYAIVLMALSFTLIALKQEPQLAISDHCTGLSNNDNKYLNTEFNLLLLIKETLNMLNGKIDEKSHHFQNDDTRYYFAHIFVLLVTMVVGNLFRGLAVSETSAIKSESELTKVIRRAQVLMRYKRVFNRRYPSLIMKALNLAGKERKTTYRIQIQPFYNNRISIFNQCSNPEISDIEDSFDQKTQLEPSRCMHLFLCFGQCTQMNPKVVGKAIQLLNKKNNIDELHENDDKKQELNKRIAKIENTLQIIIDKLNDLTKS